MTDQLHHFLEPNIQDIVPILKGSVNFDLWKDRMSMGLRARDPSLWDIMTGIEPRPLGLADTIEVESNLSSVATASITPRSSHTPSPSSVMSHEMSQIEWDKKDARVLTYIIVTIDASISDHVSMNKTSAEVYASLRKAYEVPPAFTPSMITADKVSAWQNWKYKPGMKPEAFVARWRQLFTDAQRCYPSNDRISYRYAFHVFLLAVGANPVCQAWLNTVQWADMWGSAWNLEYLFGEFVVAERRRLGGSGASLK